MVDIEKLVVYGGMIVLTGISVEVVSETIWNIGGRNRKNVMLGGGREKVV